MLVNSSKKHGINPSIFRAYDIRGIYPEEINEEAVYRIGRALAWFLKPKKIKPLAVIAPQLIVVGRDARQSSPVLRDALIKGLTGAGVDVIDIGLSSTPMLYFGVNFLEGDGGAVVTASVTGDESTLLQDVKTGRVFLSRIEQFYDFLKRSNKSSKEFAVLSFNPQSGKVSFKRIRDFFQHRPTDNVYQLILKYGRSIKVTESHSVYTYKDQKIECIPTNKLREGDLIVIPSSFFLKAEVPSFNLVEQLWPHRENLREIFVEGQDVLTLQKKRLQNGSYKRVRKTALLSSGRQLVLNHRKDLCLSRREASEGFALSPATIQRIELGHTRKFVKLRFIEKYLSDLGFSPESFLEKYTKQTDYFLSAWKDGRCFRRLKLNELSETESKGVASGWIYGRGYPEHRMPVKLQVSRALVRLIGYFIAEGNLENRVRVNFTLDLPERGHERKILENIQSDTKKCFGFPPQVYQTPGRTRVVIDNSVIFAIFAKIFGFENQKSFSKKLPDFIYKLPLEMKMDLLRALFLGDGSLSKGHYIKFTSVSRDLMVGVSYVLTQMGVNYSFYQRDNRKRKRLPTYEIVVFRRESLRKLHYVWKDHWNAASLVPKIKTKGRSFVNKSFCFNNLSFLPIKEIRTVKSPKYVYDFSVEGETFIAGCGGVCCHNSHNPPEYNGLKLVRGKAIPISGETGIGQLRDLVERSDVARPTLDERAKVFLRDIKKDYVDFLTKDRKVNLPGKVVADSGNGMAGIVLEPVFKKLDVDYEALYFTPDCSFPNHEANPFKEETLDDLKKKMKETKAFLGVAFDGDGDRVAFLDEKGEVIPASYLTALMAHQVLKEKGPGPILYDLRSSQVVPETIKKQGGEPLKIRVGHSFIKAKMREVKALFAGELSGHFYFPFEFPKGVSYFESGIFTMLKIFEIISKAQKPLSELIQAFQRYFHSGEINFEVEDKKAMIKKLAKIYKDGNISYLDGLTVEYPGWWFNVRPSNTEPLLRLNLEAKTKDLMEAKLVEIKKVLTKC